MLVVLFALVMIVVVPDGSSTDVAWPDRVSVQDYPQRGTDIRPRHRERT